MSAPRSLPVPAIRETVALPVRGGSAHWGYGTAVRPVGPHEVLLTPPSAAASAPWAVVDIRDGAVRTGRRSPGPLRDVLVPSPSAVDQRWWVLGLYGLGRLAPDGDVVEDVVRTGIGRYPHRLLALGGHHVGVVTPLSGTVAVLDARTGVRVGGVRAPGAARAVPLEDGLVRILMPESGKAYDVDLSVLRTVRRHRIPIGRGGAIVDGRLVYLEGEERPVTVLADDEEPEAGVPTVVGSGGTVGGVVGRVVVPRRLVALGTRDLDVQPFAVDPEVAADAVEVLGADARGDLVVGSRRGITLVDPSGGTVLGGLALDPVGMGMVSGTDTVVVAAGRAPQGTVDLVSW